MTILEVTTTVVVALGAIAGGVAAIIVGLEKIIKPIQRICHSRRSIAPSVDDLQKIEYSDSEVLNNLPPRIDFVGRLVERQRVRKALLSNAHILSISGIGGVGKTSLILEVAHEFLQASARGQESKFPRFEAMVWASCAGEDFSIETLLAVIARVLRYPGVGRVELQQRKLVVEELLYARPCMVILDNYESVSDAEVLKFLKSVGGKSKILITSRHQVPQANWTVSLGGLSERDGVSLIRAEGERLDIKAIEVASEVALLRLHHATGGIPLGIRWAIGQVKQRGQTFDGVLELLASARSDIFAAMFSKSWGMLTRKSRRILLAIAVLPDPVSRWTISAGSGLVGGSLDEALGKLVEVSIVDATDDLDISRRRYQLHPLTRTFVVSQMGKRERVTRACVAKLVLFYLELIQVAESTGHGGYRELDVEKNNILHIAKVGYVAQWEVAKAIPLAAKWFLREYGYWFEFGVLCDAGIREAQARGDLLALGQYAKEAAWIRCRQGNLEEASRWLEMAGSAWGGINVPVLDLADLAALKGVMEKEMGNADVARPFLVASLEDFIRHGGEDRIETLRVTTYLGELEQSIGNYDLAKQYFLTTLTKARGRGQLAAIAWSLGNLGEVEYLTGRYESAQGLLAEGLSIALGISRYHTIANCAMRLAQIYEAQVGKRASVLEYCQLALDKYRRLGIKDREFEIELMLRRITRVSE